MKNGRIIKKRSGNIFTDLKSWLIMLPGLILMTFFVWAPLLESIRMSLYKTENIELVEFIGLKNFVYVISKSNFKQALFNTFSYTFWSLLIGFFLPIVLAIIIGETTRGRGFFRTAAYLPNMLPGLAVILLWSSFFSGERSGVLNILLAKLGVAPQTYLTRADLVIPIIIVIATWKGAGATALIYMANMASFNSELYEAAAIDGAGVFKRIIHILLPSVRKLAGTLLILQIISVFQIMYEPMVLTKGGPDNASLSLMQLMWQYAFGGSMDYGKASAVAVIVTLILLVMTLVYTHFNNKESDWD
ncbi:MAG: sugar ABC transporter permease [Lachnospiraceae bacterium]|nr:sugar ABC transporter permease [Lachnospiraceae bacterium]